MKLNKGLVLIRKAGKLPGPTISEPYNIEYGSATMEVQRNSVKADQKVVIVDDVIATGGTAIAATNLLKRLGGIISGCAFVINLKNLRGAEKLCMNGFRVHYILEYE
jgi:adenine phosphoribosyltransferase